MAYNPEPRAMLILTDINGKVLAQSIIDKWNKSGKPPLQILTKTPVPQSSETIDPTLPDVQVDLEAEQETHILGTAHIQLNGKDQDLRWELVIKATEQHGKFYAGHTVRRIAITASVKDYKTLVASPVRTQEETSELTNQPVTVDTINYLGTPPTIDRESSIARVNQAVDASTGHVGQTSLKTNAPR